MYNIMCIISMISVGSQKWIVPKSLKKNSKLCNAKDNSTDETDSEVEHHGKGQIPSTDVQQTSFKSLTKTIHWNRIKRRKQKSENEGTLLLRHTSKWTVINECYICIKIFYKWHKLVFSDPLPLRKSSRIQNIMKKKRMTVVQQMYLKIHF